MCLAVPGKIVKIAEESNLGSRRGKVDFGGIRRRYASTDTPEASVGDYVLVHVGFALAVIDEQEATRVFEALEELDQLDELKEANL